MGPCKFLAPQDKGLHEKPSGSSGFTAPRGLTPDSAIPFAFSTQSRDNATVLVITPVSGQEGRRGAVFSWGFTFLLGKGSLYSNMFSLIFHWPELGHILPNSFSHPSKEVRLPWGEKKRDFLAVQQLGHCASTAGDLGLIPGRGTQIPQAMWRGPKINK